jgi:hypothetical protein
LRSFAVVIILTLVLACLSGCGGGPGAVVRLLGQTVDDGSLLPIQGARVVASPSGLEGTSDVNGNFDVADLPANATVTITAPGYQNTVLQLGNQTGDVDLGKIYLIPAPIAGTGTISGTVTAAGGEVAPGASVRAADREAKTRADGTYKLYNVPTGFQTLFAASADRNTSGTVNVTVMSQFETIANIRLTIQPPLPPT